MGKKTILVLVCLTLLLSSSIFEESTIRDNATEDRILEHSKSNPIVPDEDSVRNIAEEIPSIFDAFSPLGNYSLNTANEVQAVGTLAYYGLGSHLAIFDISNVTDPEFVSSIWVGGIVNDLYVHDNIAYVAASRGGVAIVDVGVPTDPAKVGTYLTSSPARAVHYLNDILYVLSEDVGFETVDISNVSAPEFLASYHPPGYYNNIDVKDDIAVLACDDFGAYFMNISDPSNPTNWGNYEPVGRVHDVLIEDGYAYLHSSSRGLNVINITGSTPAYVTHTNYYGNGNFDIQGELAYAAGGIDGFYIVNITNPASPFVEKTMLNYRYPRGVSVVGNIVCIANSDTGVELLNVTDIHNPEVLSSFIVPSPPNGFAIVGEYCYLTDYDVGLTILDISNPFLPEVVSICRTSNPLWDNASHNVKVIGEIACVATIKGLWTVNVSNPYDPQLLDYISPGGNGDFYAMDVEDNYCYIGGNYDFTIYDFSDPTNITVAGTYSGLSGTIISIEVKNSVAYVGESLDGFWALNVTNPGTITSMWNQETDYSGAQILVDGDILYCVGISDFSSTSILFAYNISNVATPIPVFTYDLGSFFIWALSGNLVTYNDTLFLGGVNQLVVLNISDTSHITQITREENGLRAIAFIDELLYASDHRGWWILQHDLDFDGLFSYDELQLGVDPWDPDNDKDGMPTGWEVDYGLDPTRNDANEDIDLDSLTNIEEYLEGTLPNNPDCDSDSLLDGIEVKTYGSNPWSNDTDSDSMWDPFEAQYGLDLLVDDSLDDLDGDTLSNIFEFQYGTYPNNPDSDEDEMPDNWEVFYRLDPLFNDASEDLDLDGDTNLEEYLAGTNPNDHGLRWGVQVNHTIACDLRADANVGGSVDSVSERIIIEIEDTPEGPIDVYYIPAASYLAGWANNLTPFSLSGFFTLESVLLAPAYPAIMKGNWTLFSELIEDWNTNSNRTYWVNETSTTWGFSFNVVSNGLNLTSSGSWFKTDGTVQHVTMEMNLSNGDFINVQLTRSPLDSPETQNLVIIIVIGAGGTVVVVIGLILYSKKRR